MTIAIGSVDRLRRPALTAACPALCASLGRQPDMDLGGLPEGHAAAICDSVSSALDAFRELGSDPDPTAVGGFCSESPAFRFYENGAPRYESEPDLRAAPRDLGPAMRITEGHPEPVGVRHVLVRAHETWQRTVGSPNPGGKSPKVLQNCTICVFYRCAVSCWTVPRKPENRT